MDTYKPLLRHFSKKTARIYDAIEKANLVCCTGFPLRPFETYSFFVSEVSQQGTAVVEGIPHSKFEH